MPAAAALELLHNFTLVHDDVEDASPKRHGRETLTTRDYDAWYCSPFVDSVAFQIEEVIPGARAKPIRQITESEGVVIRKRGEGDIGQTTLNTSVAQLQKDVAARG